jgi:hypothetical protein
MWKERIIEFARATIPLLATVMIALAGVGPEDAESNLAKWWELTGFEVPIWIQPPRVDQIAILAAFVCLLAWVLVNWNRIWALVEPTAETSFNAFYKLIGRGEDGKWTWKLRKPWERISSSTQGEQVTESDINAPNIVFNNDNVSETLAKCLFALDTLIDTKVYNNQILSKLSLFLMNSNQISPSMFEKIFAKLQLTICKIECFTLLSTTLVRLTAITIAYCTE